MDKPSWCSTVFSNAAILDNLFQFLPVRDLKNVRLVSKLWRNFGRPVFRRKTVVRIVDMGKFLEAFAKMPISRLSFRNYKLDGFILNRDVEDEMDAFWEKYGASIENLELFEVKLVGLEIVRDILFNVSPNLKSISLKNCTFYETFEEGQEEATGYDEIDALDENVRVNKNLTTFSFYEGSKKVCSDLPIAWEEIFMAYPNLTVLSLYDVDVDGTDTILESASSMKLKNPNCLQLKKLDMFYGRAYAEEIEPTIMDLLLSLKLSLKELLIDLGQNDMKKVAQLFHQQINVEKLMLCGENPIPGFPLKVNFNHLRHLEMTEVTVDSMEFLDVIPNLTTLELCPPPDAEPPFLDSTNVIAQTNINFAEMPLQTKITTLKIEYKISTSDVEKLIFWLPQVKKAKLFLSNESFRCVCKGWGGQLEELEVLGDKLTTEGITGIYGLKVRNREGMDTDIPQIECSQINITCLINLRQFVMTNYGRPTGIDNVCVDEGFMKLPYLNYLSICTMDITDGGWRKLFNWKQLMILKASNGKSDWACATTFSRDNYI